MLEKKFQILCSNYSQDIQVIDNLWNTIKDSYNTSTRHYHNLNHLVYIYKELEHLNFSKQVWQELQFTLFYHDIIYDVKKDNNEEQSAIVAQQELSLINIEKKNIKNIMQLINETKIHQTNSKNNAYFLDADLAILGTSNSEYQKYIIKIRKEYAFYTDEVYKKGRKKVLNFFLNKKRIFQTFHFYNKYEKQSRSNLLSEYHQL